MTVQTHQSTTQARVFPYRGKRIPEQVVAVGAAPPQYTTAPASGRLTLALHVRWLSLLGFGVFAVLFNGLDAVQLLDQLSYINIYIYE